MESAVSNLRLIGPNLWNVRGSYYPVCFVNMGSQMTIIRLPSGFFLILSTIALSSSLKEEIDILTDGGKYIEAVIATHPFHTLYFTPFYHCYPHAKYYGTPRHLKKFPQIKWSGSVADPSMRAQWEEHGVFMRITAGSNFENPFELNHFASLFVFHAESKTIHDEDTIMYYDHPGCFLRCLGARHDQLSFNPAPWFFTLSTHATASLEFKQFIEEIIADWDFDNIVAGHTGVKIGDGKEALVRTLQSAERKLVSIQERREMIERGIFN